MKCSFEELFDFLSTRKYDNLIWTWLNVSQSSLNIQIKWCICIYLFLSQSPSLSNTSHTCMVRSNSCVMKNDDTLSEWQLHQPERKYRLLSAFSAIQNMWRVNHRRRCRSASRYTLCPRPSIVRPANLIRYSASCSWLGYCGRHVTAAGTDGSLTVLFFKFIVAPDLYACQI